MSRRRSQAHRGIPLALAAAAVVGVLAAGLPFPSSGSLPVVAAAPGGSTLYGQLLDGATSRPVENGYVFVLKPGSDTILGWSRTRSGIGSGGAWEIGGLPDGGHVLVVGYYPYSDNSLALARVALTGIRAEVSDFSTRNSLSEALPESMINQARSGGDADALDLLRLAASDALRVAEGKGPDDAPSFQGQPGSCNAAMEQGVRNCWGTHGLTHRRADGCSVIATLDLGGGGGPALLVQTSSRFSILDRNGNRLLHFQYLSKPDIEVLGERDEGYSRFIGVASDGTATVFGASRSCDEGGGLPFCYQPIRRADHDSLPNSAKRSGPTPKHCPSPSAREFHSDTAPVILLHGFNSSTDAWDCYAEHLRESGWGECTLTFASGSSDPRESTCPVSASPKFIRVVFENSSGQDLVTQGQQVARAVAIARQEAGASKVTLVGHSMGGLAARAYVQSLDFARREDVALVVTVATPHGGSLLPYLTRFDAEKLARALVDPVQAAFYSSTVALGATVPAISLLAPDSTQLEALNTATAPFRRFPNSVRLAAVMANSESGADTRATLLSAALDLFRSRLTKSSWYDAEAASLLVGGGVMRNWSDGVVPFASQYPKIAPALARLKIEHETVEAFHTDAQNQQATFEALDRWIAEVRR